MKWRRLLQRSIGVAMLGSALALAPACGANGRLYVRVGPPGPIVEARAVAPGPGYIWIDGYQRWDGNSYVWVGGRWERPPHPRSVWVPGRWQQDRNRGWFWVEGRWRG